MPSHHERVDFAPPPPRGQLRAFGLAVLAHVLLIVALSVTLHWKRDAEDAAVEAELWSSTVMQAAPKLAPTPPQVAPEPPAPVAKRPEPPPAPQTKDADIALEKARKQAELKRQQEELAKQQALKDKQAKEKAEKDKREKAEKLAADKREADEKRKADAKKLEQQAKADDQKRRDEVIRRMTAMAGSGAPDATGNAERSSAPSAAYGASLAALFKRNVVFANPESIEGNPKATVEVRVGPSGTILSATLVKSSGVPAWDDAVVRAVRKTDRIPSDNGRYPSVFPVVFGPKDTN